MDVLHVDGSRKQRRNLGVGEACDAAADARDQEGQLRVLLGKSDELVDVGLDGVHTALHRRDGVALALQPNALTHDGAKLLDSYPRRSATVHALQVAAKDEDFVFAEAMDVVGRDATFELTHFAVVAGLAVRLGAEQLAGHAGHGRGGGIVI